MFTNRLKGAFRAPEERTRAPDYWLIRADCGYFTVSRETVQRITAELRRFWRPRWIRFRDLAGSEIHLPSRAIEIVGESTATQRAFDRRLRQALAREDDEDEDEDEDDARPWGA